VIAVHTACTITKEKLIRYGFDAEKIVLIPLGLDLNTFKPCSSEQKQMLKEKLRLPKDKLIIGSFQKDGQGWGEGNDPKLEKGPDVFCDTVEQIAHKYPVHVLLTGPARGYVKKRLQDAGISFTHDYLKEYKNIIEYYQALDLYIVSSREEGGPMAILECMASGIPFVTTPVGMVPDIIKDRYNGLVTTSVNSAELAQKACELVESSNLKEQIIQNGLIVVKDYDWDKISQRYYNALYSKLLS
jgi:glycosyltransferase involved in cell wall biosynthesis